MKILSNQYDYLILDAADRYGVPFEWIKGVIGAESDFNARAYRAEPRINDASYGLMQLLYRTAQGLGYSGPADGLYDPATNIDLGTHFLRDLMREYGDDFDAVYSAYNSGSPTKYQTSSQVAAHVERAWSYVDAVLQSVASATAQAAGDAAEYLGVEDESSFWLMAAGAALVVILLLRK